MGDQMKTYVSTIQFNVGLDDATSLVIFKGDTVQFDGTKAVVGGDTMNLPKLRAALRVGWLVEEGTGKGNSYQAPSAKINVRGATPQQQDNVHDGATAIADEERIVSMVEDRSVFVEDQSSLATEKAHTRSADTTVFEHRVPAQTKYDVVQDTDASGQEAVPLGLRFKTSATTKTDLSKVGDSQLTKMVEDLENQARSAPDGVKAPRVSEGITFSNYNVGDRAALGVEDTGGTEGVDLDAMQQGTVVTSHPHHHYHLHHESDSPCKGGDNPPQLAELGDDELDDALDLETREGRWNIAKIIYPDLPEWDFSMNWRHKIDLLQAEYSEQGTVLRSIYAAESEAIKKRMKALFDL